MEPKYRITDQTKTLSDGTVVHRIEALRDGPWGLASTLGGWISGEHNLSHEGDCWVSENAMIFDEAIVYGNAWVFGNAEISENAKIFGKAKIFEKAQGAGTAKVHGNAQIFGDAYVYRNAKVYGNQKVNGYCFLHGNEKGQEFQVHNICVCDYKASWIKEYYGCFWIISKTYPGWVQAKHGDEEIAFRNNWLRKI